MEEVVLASTRMTGEWCRIWVQYETAEPRRIRRVRVENAVAHQILAVVHRGAEMLYSTVIPAASATAPYATEFNLPQAHRYPLEEIAVRLS